MSDQPAPPSVLIVDRSADSRAVLRDLLERDGAAVVEARDAAEAARAVALRTPAAVVLDADADPPREGVTDADALTDWATRTDTPVVVVGTKRATAAFPAAREFVRKPYHYPALVNKIHRVMASRDAA